MYIALYVISYSHDMRVSISSYENTLITLYDNVPPTNRKGIYIQTHLSYKVNMLGISTKTKQTT